jgi:hypothetical protein
MVRTFCLQYEKDWDDGVHLLLFAGRDDVQEFIGFSPVELVVGHTVSELFFPNNVLVYLHDTLYFVYADLRLYNIV